MAPNILGRYYRTDPERNKIMRFEILFKNNKPIPFNKITELIHGFGVSYNRTVQDIIQSTEGLINKDLFIRNTVKILNNFKMTRQGRFKGLGFDAKGKIKGPVKLLDQCWGLAVEQLIELKSRLTAWKLTPRSRTILLMTDEQLDEVAGILWSAFKNLLPVTMSKQSYGLVGASKILFALFPEIALPVDNVEWKQVFKMVDLSDVIKLMADEIREWEERTGTQLETCENKDIPTTLPAIYNVMAMKARDKK